MSEGDANDDLFDDGDSDGDPDVELAPASPRRLFVVFGLALAAFVFIGIAAAALITVLVLRTRDHVDPNHTVRQKYHARYATCIAGGGGADVCSAKVLVSCESDGWWTNPTHRGQRETVCLATIPGPKN